MKINIPNLINTLTQHETSEEAIITAKVNPILDILARFNSSNSVDFSQFTDEDIRDTMDAIWSYDPEEGCQENDPNNPIVVFMDTANIREKIVKLKPKGSDTSDFI